MVDVSFEADACDYDVSSPIFRLNRLEPIPINENRRGYSLKNLLSRQRQCQWQDKLQVPTLLQLLFKGIDLSAAILYPGKLKSP